MLQRIQTILLFLAAACFFSLFKLPFMDTPDATASMNFLADGTFNVHDHVLFLIMTGLAGGLALLSIVLFNNRPLQMRLGYILIAFAILIPLLAFLLFYQEWKVIPDGTELEVEFGVLPPILALILIVLANYFIKKDEKLVKSMDRLR